MVANQEMIQSPAVIENKPLPLNEKLQQSSTGVQEKKPPPNAQALIDAHNRYREFTDTFQQLEDDNTTPAEVLQPPWDKIQETIQERKVRIGRVMARVTESKTPDQLGQALYMAKDRSDSTPPEGTVKAYQKGSCIVIIVDNEDDLRRVCNIKKEDKIKNNGEYQSGVTYEFGSEWNDRIREVPTVVVLDSGKNTAEERVRHEISHHTMDLYIRESNPEVLQSVSSISDALDAITTFNSGSPPLTESQLLDRLRSYFQHMKSSALLEASAEMMANHKMDWRDSYSNNYFNRIIPPDTEGSAAVLPLINKIKGEFEQDYDDTQKKVGQIVEDFKRIEKDDDVVFGTIGMMLCTTAPNNIGTLINDMDFIGKLYTGNEYHHPKQDLDEVLYSVRTVPISSSERDKLYEDTSALIKELVDEANNAQINQHFGYTLTRQMGEGFPSAMGKASIARETYLENILPIIAKKDKIVEEIKRQTGIEKERVAIELQKPVTKPVGRPEVKSKPRTKTGILAKLQKWIK